MSISLRGALFVPAALWALLCTSCSESDAISTPPASPTSQPTGGSADASEMAPLPDKVTIDSPSDPVVLMEIVEDYSEEVANRFVAFAYELKRRDFDAAREWIAPEFAGQSLFADYESETADMPLDASRETFAFESAPVQGKTAWLDSIKDGIGAWEHVDAVVFKVKGAEFQRGRPLWGKVRFKLSFLGSAIGGGPEAVTVWTWARVEKRRGKWTMTGLELTSRKTERRDAPLFTEVSSSTGLGHAGVRFGKQGNTLFAWQGVAGGDVNGDGLWDLFLTSQSRNFLYLAQPNGGFEESADAWGVRKPAGGTSSLFLDFDNDGDQDLFVADEGWLGPNGQTQGNPLRLFVNKGDKYEEQGASLGFTGMMPAYTLTALDYDMDGFVDVFVCNYGVQNKENNNDWLNATNGGKNALFRNEGGKGFTDVAAAAGLDDGRWTYASAAADFDGDGDTDLNVVNDYGENSLLENQGDGTFADRSEEWGIGDRGNGMGTMWGDFNSDGRLDLYVANMSSTAGNRILKRMESQDSDVVQGLFKMAAGNSIFVQKEDGTFEAQASSMGGVGASWAWCPLTFDMDLDGHLDVYNCSGYVTGDSAEDT